jgi:hypothetical protein
MRCWECGLRKNSKSGIVVEENHIKKNFDNGSVAIGSVTKFLISKFLWNIFYLYVTKFVRNKCHYVSKFIITEFIITKFMQLLLELLPLL